jgi:DNA (cytosine-5)-methyltransferase 1
MIFASLFSGFGLADIGAKMANCDLAWGVELNPEIAEVSQQLGHKVFCQSVVETEFNRLERPDILWASPPCPNFSIAKHKATETEIDLDLAKAVIRAVETLKPKYFILENVEGYQKSRSFKLIQNFLYEVGYWVDSSVLNAADFRVPQTRRRLIVRAAYKSLLPPLPLPRKWLGWYQAIEDMIDSLPKSHLARWHLDRLPEWLAKTVLIDLPKALLIPGSNSSSFSVRRDQDPSLTIGDTGRVGNRPRAILLNSDQAVWRSTTKSDLESAFKSAQVVAMTTRALARFQSMPDWYELPESKRLACLGIGNGVPCLLAETIIKSLELK